MADGLSFEMITKPFDDMLADMHRTADKTTMYALRATGRAVAREAKKSVPVYSGPDKRVTPGELKKSIKNSRRLTKNGTGDYGLSVGPFGSKKKGTAVHYRNGSSGALRGVPLYRGKIEDRVGYMKRGISDVDFRRTFEDALAKAFEKYR